MLRPTDRYEVAIAIEHLSLPTKTRIEIGGVTFAHFDGRRARSWRLLDALLAKDIIGHTASIVRVQAGTFERAREIAGEQIDTALALLRCAMATSRAVAPLDILFLQRRGGRWAARRLTGRVTSTGGFSRGSSSVDLDLRTALRSSAEPLIAAAGALGARAAPLFDGSRAGPLTDALVRALEWIGSSLTRESYDDKVVDLCTALECMLTNESARLKGHAIALQYILLIDVTGGGNYINPRAVLPICELRSAVIHGAKRRVASGIHYDALREVCLATFEAIMRVVAAHSELRSVKQLVDLLESKPDRIESVPQWVLGDQRTDRDLLKFAAKIAAERRERTTEIASREER